MSFLLSSFFAVPVSSTMGLPLSWVSLPSTSSAGALLSWAPVVLGLFRAEVVSARLNPSHGTIDVMRVFVPRFFVSSQQRFGATDIKALSASQLSGLGRILWERARCRKISFSTMEEIFFKKSNNQIKNSFYMSIYRLLERQKIYKFN